MTVRPGRSRRAALAGSWLLLGALLSASPAAAAEAVTLQLKWEHQFQFAGYYQAVEQGYLRDAGLEVRLVPAKPGTDPMDEVLAGRAQYGIGASDLALARARGAPLVAVAAIFQHSPLVFLARRDGPVQSIHDLAGRRIAFEPQASELIAYLKRENVPLQGIERLPLAFDLHELKDRTADAMTAYVTDEVFPLRQMGIDVEVFSPRSAGIDFYGDVLFTTEAEVDAHPQRVHALRAAVVRGWDYALKHSEETISLIRERYSTRHSVEHLRFEAEKTQKLVVPDLVEIGHQSEARWRHIADVYAEIGMLPPDVKLDGLVYQPDAKRAPTWLAPALVGSLAALVVLGVTAAVIGSLYLRLRRANAALEERIREIEALGRRLSEQAVRDALTGLFNRRYLDETLPRELARAGREGQSLALVALDLDRFKRINDAHGHAAGDAVLRAVAELLQRSVRRSDVVCRAGGEEMTLVLPGMGREAAVAWCERLRESVAATVVQVDDGPVQVTTSMGVALYPEHGETPHELMVAADRALYAAKRAGRDRVHVATGRPELGATPESTGTSPPVAVAPAGGGQ